MIKEYGLAFGMRVYFSPYHLWAARHFMGLAKKIEDAHTGKSVFSIEHRAYVTNSIFSSFAFLDSLINEHVKDKEDDIESFLNGITDNPKTFELPKLADNYKKEFIKILKQKKTNYKKLRIKRKPLSYFQGRSV